MSIKWKNYIVSSPNVLKGKPVIKGTRIPVSLVLGYLSEDYSFEGIIKEFPDITKKQISACLSFAKDLSEFEIAA